MDRLPEVGEFVESSPGCECLPLEDYMVGLSSIPALRKARAGWSAGMRVLIVFEKSSKNSKRARRGYSGLVWKHRPAFRSEFFFYGGVPQKKLFFSLEMRHGKVPAS